MAEKFETYEDRFPYESNFIEGNEPKLQVERLGPEESARCRLIGTGEGLDRFVHVANEYPIEEVSLILQGISNPVRFDKLAYPERIATLRMTRTVNLDETFDERTFQHLKLLTGLRSLELNLVPLKVSDFPQLKQIEFLSFDAESFATALPFENLAGLSELRIVNFSGALTELGSVASLKKLSLVGAKIRSLGEISELFPHLETLSIDGRGKGLELEPLSKCRNLTSLKLMGIQNPIGLEALVVPSLKQVYIGKLDGPEFFERNKQLEWFRAKTYTGRASAQLKSRGWAKIGKEWGTAGGFIPEELRN